MGFSYTTQIAWMLARTRTVPVATPGELSGTRIDEMQLLEAYVEHGKRIENENPTLGRDRYVHGRAGDIQTGPTLKRLSFAILPPPALQHPNPSAKTTITFRISPRNLFILLQLFTLLVEARLYHLFTNPKPHIQEYTWQQIKEFLRSPYLTHQRRIQTKKTKEQKW
ncbi:hypothetical protein IFR05_011047 [Cadophora sp. M221]|nr:hypothetical protein IFR05_011047 [Cadophora sp. M221]